MAARIGSMRYRVEIQQRAGEPDALANDADEWETIHTVWADIVPVSGREYFAAETETSEVTVKIFARYIGDVTAKMRVKHGKHIYEIVDVLPAERTRYMTLMAREAY